MTESRPGGPTKERILEAALETVKREGFAGASARAVARTGGFNQALIYYYYGSLNELLLATLEETSQRRLASYRARMSDIRSLEDLARVGGELYAEDLQEGHIAVLTELLTAALPNPDMGPRIVAAMQPWVELAEDAIGRVIRGTVAEGMLPARTLAHGLVAFYVGIEMLYHLDRDESRAEELFRVFTNLAAVAGPLLGADISGFGQD
ncbi:MAG: TetR/AcrR family transcriptional regulator [Actinomycetota bacterium]